MKKEVCVRAQFSYPTGEYVTVSLYAKNEAEYFSKLHDALMEWLRDRFRNPVQAAIIAKKYLPIGMNEPKELHCIKVRSESWEVREANGFPRRMICRPAGMKLEEFHNAV